MGKNDILVIGTGGAGSIGAVSDIFKEANSARERAEKWLEFYGFDVTDDLIRRIEILLLVQDRDTRHACAENVLDSDSPSRDCMNANSFYVPIQ